MIDFYILENATLMKAYQFACALIEKAYQANQSCYVYTQNQAEAERIDNLLWTFKDISFVPHQLINPLGTPCSIEIGAKEAARDYDLVVNFNQTAVNFKFNRLIEIVYHDAAMQQLARERFKQYRNLNYKITTHKLKVNEYDNFRENLST